jgi:hypothetical protein
MSEVFKTSHWTFAQGFIVMSKYGADAPTFAGSKCSAEQKVWLCLVCSLLGKIVANRPAAKREREAGDAAVAGVAPVEPAFVDPTKLPEGSYEIVTNAKIQNFPHRLQSHFASQHLMCDEKGSSFILRVVASFHVSDQLAIIIMKKQQQEENFNNNNNNHKKRRMHIGSPSNERQRTPVQSARGVVLSGAAVCVE